MSKVLRNRRADQMRIHSEGFRWSLRLTPTFALLHRYAWRREDLHGPPSAAVAEFRSHASDTRRRRGGARLLGRRKVREVRPIEGFTGAGRSGGAAPAASTARTRPVHGACVGLL